MTLDKMIEEMFTQPEQQVRATWNNGLHLTLDKEKSTFSLTRLGVAPSHFDVEIVEAVLFTMKLKVSKNRIDFTKGNYHVVRLSYTVEPVQNTLFELKRIFEYA
jgi:hypothetical protein